MCCVVVQLCVPSACDYSLVGQTQTDYGWDYVLQRMPDADHPHDLELLTMSVYFETEYRVRVLIRDANSSRWEVPSDIRPLLSQGPPTSIPSSLLYEFQPVDIDTRFGFYIRRAGGGPNLFDTATSHLFYAPQYLELTSSLQPGHFLYGLGERNASLRLQSGNYTLWNADNYTQPQINMYGSHPAYFSLNPDDAFAHAVVLVNSNEMGVELTDAAITFRITGGVIDLYFLLGPTPQAVVDQYTELVGRPYLNPLWSLGWHTCRWGFSSLNYTMAVVDGYLREGIPLDVVWHDIDYMHFYFDFTFDPQRFATDDLRAFNAFLDAHGMRHVYIVDPGIPALALLPDNVTVYQPYAQGKEAGVFIRHPANDSLLYACVWPSVPVVFPDFTHPAALQWWTTQIQQWTAAVGLPAGLWLDMNEISSFVPGQLPAGYSSCEAFGFRGPDWSNITMAGAHATTDTAAVGHAPVSSPSDIALPQYLPGGLDPNLKSINVSSILHASQFYNLHNLFGLYEQRASRMALEALQTDASTGRANRSFTLSRATFLGSGAQGASWTGDHDGQWEDLKVQVRMFQQMGLHGVTMIGSDLCGLGGLAEVDGDGGAEVCTRWVQLGALSPFARMHYQDWVETRHREPYAWAEPARSISRRALLLRYSLLLYLNSLAIDAHLSGLPLWRPMWFEFTTDQTTWVMDQQVMVGGALLFPPVTDPRAQNVTAYVPNGLWYDWHTHALVSPFPPTTATGSFITVPAAYTVNATTPLLMRGGRIVAAQTPGMTTGATHGNPLILHVALNESGQASGYVYLEDGISLTAVDQGDYQRIAFDAAFNVSAQGLGYPLSGTLNVTGFNGSATGFNVSGYSIQAIVIKGVTSAGPINITVGGGSLGQSCVQLNATAVTSEGSGVRVEELTGLLVLTAPVVLSFNDGCVLPAEDEESFSLVVPIVVLVLLFLAVVGALLWFRSRKAALGTEEEAQAVHVQERRRVLARPAPTTAATGVLSPSATADANPEEYGVGPDGAVIRKKRRVLKKKKTPRSAATNQLEESLIPQNDTRSIHVV